MRFPAVILLSVIMTAVGLVGAAPAASADTIAEVESLGELILADDYDRDTHASLLRLYQAFFGREPDIDGAKYWIKQSGTQTLIQIAEFFTLSDEYANAYVGTDDDQFLTRVYANVLGRDFDQAGFDYWLDTLRGSNDSGSNADLKRITRGELVRWVSASDEFIAEFAYAPGELIPPDPEPQPAPGVTPCPLWDGGSPRVTEFSQAPPMCIETDAVYLATVVTDRGAFTIELEASKAPQTVNNFIVLSLYHFYDGVGFHRVIPGFVVQGGDATGQVPGFGDPGYEFDDELPTPDPETGRAYEIGSVAMANSGPDTNGSQFFIVTGAIGVELPPLYSEFGTVIAGLDVVAQIDALGSADGTPTELVKVNAIGITKR